ncbi:site-specific integrase [Micromonospora sp. CPCC 205539]|uniref:site-specific integrase n=1 Tax=Micromonospora sp. CPCC 205539 TaxID=3122408 RepID=UPI002FEF0F6D
MARRATRRGARSHPTAGRIAGAGALALRLIDPDTDHALIRLCEKGATQRWQPITPMLAKRLNGHARARGAVAPIDGLLRYRNGQPATYRRYDLMWRRIGRQLPWVAAQGITRTGCATPPGSNATSASVWPAPTPGTPDRRGPATTTHIKADLHAVVTALAALAGQPHPLAGGSEGQASPVPVGKG